MKKANQRLPSRRRDRNWTPTPAPAPAHSPEHSSASLGGSVTCWCPAPGAIPAASRLIESPMLGQCAGSFPLVPKGPAAEPRFAFPVFPTPALATTARSFAMCPPGPGATPFSCRGPDAHMSQCSQSHKPGPRRPGLRASNTSLTNTASGRTVLRATVCSPQTTVTAKHMRAHCGEVTGNGKKMSRPRINGNPRCAQKLPGER